MSILFNKQAGIFKLDALDTSWSVISGAAVGIAGSGWTDYGCDSF